MQNGRMDLAPDWLSIVNLCLTALLGWKTLGPRRKTKLELMLSGNHAGPNDEQGYRTLLVRNKGHFPANGLILKPQNKGGIGGQWQVGNIPPWEIVSAGTRLRGYEGVEFLASYLDADNKLTRKRLKIKPGTMHSIVDTDDKIKTWISQEPNDA